MVPGEEIVRKWAERLRGRLRQRGNQLVGDTGGLPPAPLLSLEDWTPRDQELQEWSRTALSPAAVSWLYEGGEPGELLRELAPNLYELDGLFDPRWLTRLSEEIQQVREWANAHSVEIRPPNSMHYGGFELAPIGLGDLVNQISSDLVTTLARRLYPSREWPELRDGHGFLADYGAGADRDLSLHVDDSDVTLTLCLGQEFEGSDVVFEGIRCPLHQQNMHHPEEEVWVAPVPGRAILHLGAHRHRVSPLLRGTRQSVILWARGLFTQDERMGIGVADCPDWCGE